MKRVFKIIAITLACVIGALGLAVGGMYLFGGFDEKIVYANDLSFSQIERISSETMYMQVNTSTEGVTRTKLKLIATPGGNTSNIIDFPEEIYIGQPFIVSPKRDANGKNVGGNVKLTAFYDSIDADLNAKAECNILIDIPVEQVNVKMPNYVLKPGEQITSLFKEGELISTGLDIAPLNSLTPYVISGTQAINSFADKKIELELCYKDGTPLGDNKNVATFRVNNDVNNKKTRIEVKYDVKDINGDKIKDVVFHDNVYIISGNQADDVILKAYTYATYKQQEANTIRDADGNVVEIPLNKEQTLQTNLGFSIGSAEAIDMTFNSNNKEVYLNEEIRIFLNTEDRNMRPNDINLGLDLVSDSPTPIGDFTLRENIYLQINNNYITLKNSSEKEEDQIQTSEGLKLSFDGISTQKDEWHWLFKINDFKAYYNFKNNDETILATIVYKGKENNIVKTFKIVPKAYEVESLSTKYQEGTTAIKAQSNSKLQFSNDNISLNSDNLPEGKDFTFKELEHYISYDKNDNDNGSTVNTIPTKPGKYKATFDFYIGKSAGSFNIRFNPEWVVLEKVVFTQGVKTYTIPYSNGIAQTPVKVPANATFDELNVPVSVEVLLQIKKATTDKNLFYVETEEEIIITNTMIKFYEGTVAAEGAEVTYSTIPYLAINNIRFYVDFDYYKDERTDIQYLRINDDIDTSSYKVVQGIGSFYITTQLVYIDENTNEIYWIGKSVDTKIDVIEILSNLSAYNYNVQDNKAEDFGTDIISYDEAGVDEYYIFISSTTMESLKNYVIYNKINISVKQNLNGINIANYPGIMDINANAIEFVSDWIEVLKDEKVIGYKIAYRINEIHSISVNGTMLDNVFNIIISVDVDEHTTVKAEFMLDSVTENFENPQFLDVNIKDKTIKSARIVYEGNTDNSISKPLDIKAYIENEDIKWTGGDFESKLKYFFGYSADAIEGIIDSMTYDISVVDSSKVALTNLYNFQMKHDSKTGIGGLSFNNFPVNLGADGKNQGVLLKLTVYSLGVYGFNSHYAWNPSLESFVQTQNPGLSADIYIRVYGLELNIEVNNKEVFGIKDDEEKLQNGTAGIPFIGEDGLFKLTGKNGNGGDLAIHNYAKVMSTFINNENLYLSKDGSKLYFKNDFLIDENVQFIFYVGTNANKIRIKTGADGQTNIYQNYYDQLIKSAYQIEVTSSFNSPSQNQVFATITYKGAPVVGEGEEDTFDISTLLDISIEVKSTTLSSSYNINQPIVVNNATNLLTFKTAPVKYNAVIRLALTKKDGSNTTYKDYTIEVNPIYSNNDLTIGTFYDSGLGEDFNYYIIAGNENLISTVNSGIIYSNELDNTKSNIKQGQDGVEIIFEDIETTPVGVEAHMGKVVKTGELQIWSYDLNYVKTIKVTLIFNYEDGGKFIYIKYLNIRPNLDLQFKNNTINSNVTALNLTNSNNYVFIRNSEEQTLEMPDFVYDDFDASYNSTSFVYDVNVLSDISSTTSDNQDFLLKPLVTSLQISGVVEKTIIKFNYVSNRGYILTFEMPLFVQYVASGEYILKTKQTEFDCSTTNQYLFGLFQKTEGGAETELDLADYASVMEISLKEIIVSIPDKYSVENPIVFDSNNYSFTFKTISVDYEAKIYMEFKPLIGNSKKIIQEFIINVNTIYSQEDLVVGNLYVDEDAPENNYYFIDEGVENAISSENGKIDFNNYLETNKLNINSFEVSFEKFKLNPEDEDDKQNPGDYMSYSFENNILKIWCKSISEDKNIKINITLHFEDGGKLVFEGFILKVING